MKEEDEVPELLPTPGVLGPALARALEQKGYATLTPIQQAVLAPETEGRDLRLTSQTGSGKTVAIGILLRELAERGRAPKPLALVVTPTRELAKQFRDELGWLYAAVGTRIAVVTGGSSYVLEQRALKAEPAVVVGTPGRLLDHLERGTFDASAIEVIVLDEADRMLDLGFREDLEKMFSKLPSEHRTHLLSATFPRDVERLANRVQKNPLHVEGTRLGDANIDIEHVLHIVALHERFPALVNLLLAGDELRALVFAKTRAEVSQLSDELSRSGFRVATLSGELEQRERTRALAAFREGKVSILVATDVAARGLDVVAVDRVVHFTAPTEPDAYTHRSGRTGRAGRRGTSHVLVAPRELLRVRRVLDSARVTYRLEPVPSKADVEHLRAARLVEELTRENDSETTPDARTQELVRRLATAGDVQSVIARLLARSDFSRLPPARDVTPVDLTARRDSQGSQGSRDARDGRDHRDPRDSRDGGRDAGRFGPRDGARPPPRDRIDSRSGDTVWMPFRVTWGTTQGADPRRVLAMVCRRGGIESRNVGAIRINATWSTVDVSADVADVFATAAGRPDPRDSRVTIQPDRPHADRAPAPARAHGRPPERVADRRPESVPDRDRGADRGFSHAPNRATDRRPESVPDRGPHRGPDRPADRGASRGPERKPERAPERKPERAPERKSERALDRGPDRGPPPRQPDTRRADPPRGGARPPTRTNRRPAR